MNRYEKYKDSGIAWLGEVPEHWSICRLKDEVTFNDEVLGDKTDTDYEILYVDISSVSLIEGIIQKELMTFENSPSRARRIVKNGDVIVSTVRTYLKAITQIQDAEDNLIVSTGFAVLRPKENLFPRFLGYWVQSENMIGAIVSNSVGVSYPAINATDLVRLPIVKLPLKEQTAIAHYLDTKLGEIDALIDKQQTLLEKLAERRTATITAAVTRGLNPNAPMKNSGVEWLGDVLAHWEMKAIKRVVKEHAGNGFPIELQGNNGDVPFLKVSDLNKGGKLLEDFANSVTRNIIYEMKWNIVPKFSLVTAKIGEALKKNHRKIISQDSIIDNNCIAFECLGINLDYHYYLSLIIDFDWFENGGTVPSLSVQKYKNQKICIPSLEEQAAIADYLDQETTKIDRLCDTVNQTIGRLKEYRTALITQAVTGKIKVTDE